MGDLEDVRWLLFHEEREAERASRDLWEVHSLRELLNAGAGVPAPFRRLEPYLERMSAEQIRLVMHRFAPAGKATRRVAMIAEVEAALNSPDRLDAVLAGLEPAERVLLDELGRRGGVLDGWELVSVAALYGHEPPRGVTGGMSFDRQLGRSGAAVYLARLILEGVLLPASTAADWFQYGSGGDANNLIAADERLLARLLVAPPAPLAPLALAPVTGAVLMERHPATLLLELYGVLQLVAREGGLKVTRRGAVAKPFLSRLERASPLLAGKLEQLLRVLAATGLVRLPEDESGGAPWPLDQKVIAELRSLPLHVQYAVVIDTSCHVRDPAFDHSWRWESPYAPTEPKPFWRALVDSLLLLPDHPVKLEHAIQGLWEGGLRSVFASGNRGFNSSPASSDAQTPPPATLAVALAGPLYELGLLARGEAEDPELGSVAVLALGEGARWYESARSLVHGRTSARTADLVAFPDAAIDSEPSDTGRLSSSTYALLVQPNFEILVYLDRLDAHVLMALEPAMVERIDAHTATFRIDRTSLGHTLEAGATVDEVLARLGALSPGLPQNVVETMRDWAARRERLRLHLNARLLEYAGRDERDAALATLVGARPMGERFALLDANSTAPPGATGHDYRQPPTPMLTFADDDSILTTGELDLVARAALGRVARPLKDGGFELDLGALRGGGLTPNVREALEARSKNGLPPRLDALQRAWSSASPPPVVTTASLFRHPDATLLAQFKSLRGLLAGQLSPSTYIVRPGREAELEAELSALGLSVGTEVGVSLDQERVPSQLAATGEGELLEGMSTRKMRELIENAIDAGHYLELKYAEELEGWNRYGSLRRSRGRTRHELLKPDDVVYEGSLPYLLATTLKRGADRTIRIGYIVALAVRTER